MRKPYFIAEVSSNHAQDIDRCKEFIATAAQIGCDAVKFQLFRVDELFAPEILAKSADHRARRQWELPVSFLPELKQSCVDNNISFSCTPFYLAAVEELRPYVDFYKIASYELLWHDLIEACAKTGVPTLLSTGMADIFEISAAAKAFKNAGGHDLTLFHCVSGYPAPPEQCNLAAIETIADATGLAVGWSDHSRTPAVIERAVHKYGAPVIEFHLDLDETGAEYKTGHCWLPNEIEPVIRGIRLSLKADGDGVKQPTAAEISDRIWRADPSDGVRPTLAMREQWRRGLNG